MFETPKKLFYTTLIFSVIVQIISGVIELSALNIDLPKEQNILRQVLMMELAVQGIEATFYGWLVTNLNNISDITPKRYLDWIVTTPTMLLSLIVYLIYLNHKNPIELSLFNVFKANVSCISYISILNWVMLLFGYLGEMNLIPIVAGVAIGFIPFLMYFYEIYRNYVGDSGSKLFWYFFVFWSLYGVVAVLPYYLKNAFYNILDLFSKNFFGLFISYLILTKSY
jgi:bacteriorhodopsin